MKDRKSVLDELTELEAKARTTGIFTQDEMFLVRCLPALLEIAKAAKELEGSIYFAKQHDLKCHLQFDRECGSCSCGVDLHNNLIFALAKLESVK